jgi:DHA2 family multidrug resistance protein
VSAVATSLNGPVRPVAPAGTEAFDLRKLAAFIFMVFGMFMAILDIQVVSASLSEIQAGLSASSDEITWVQTSYLIAEVIMIPLSGFLSRAFSTRYIFVASAAGFTLMSFFCANATSINEMIVAPIIGLVATLAPTIGPTVGGYLTDAFSWHWLFLINIIPGIAVSIGTWLLIDFDKPDLSLLKRFDWAGLASMAAFLGALEYALEEGPSKDWFESEPVTAAIVISFVGAIIFFWRAFRAPQPIVDLGAFADRNFWTGSLFSFVMGIGLYGLTYIYPVYLASVRGYSSLQIGETMFVTGVCMFIMAPISGRLMGLVDPRLMIAVGFTGFGLGTLQASYITQDWDFWELLVPQMLRGFSLMLCMVPINNLALGTMPPERLKNASGLFNLTRNLGGAVGLALINTVLDKRIDLHLARLHEAISWGRTSADETMAELTAAFASRGSDAGLAAAKQMMLMARRQAEVMSLGDVFLSLTVIFFALVALAPIMRRPQMQGAGGGGGH